MSAQPPLVPLQFALLSRQAASGASAPASGPATASPGEVADTLYAGKKAPLRPLHHQLMAMVHAMGPDVSLAPKKGTSACVARGSSSP